MCFLPALGLLFSLLAIFNLPAHAEAGADDTPEAASQAGRVVLYQPQDEVKEPPETPEDDSFQEDEPIGGIRKLTEEEINRVRYMELRGMRLRTERPDRVSVKVPKETINDFLLDMEGHPQWRGEETRRQFRRLTAPQKLHWIARYRGAKYADRVEIQSDPEIFLDFKKHVFPVAIRSCASSGCHGYGTTRRPFVLFNDPKRSTATTYADFVALATFEYNGHRILDRAHPEESLLLTYLLPEKDVRPELRHPGDAEIRPGFRTRRSLGYRRIRDWIASLKHPAEDYRVNLWSDAEAQEEEPEATIDDAAKPEQDDDSQS